MVDEAQPATTDQGSTDATADGKLAPTVHLTVKSATGEVLEIDLLAATFLRICWSLPAGKDGYQRAVEVAQFGAWLVKESDLSGSEMDRLRGVFAALYQYAEREKWTTRLDAVLSACYHMLRDRVVSRNGAAEFASEQLGEDIKPEAWRKRVDRWASARRLPPVGNPRKPKKRVESAHQIVHM